MWDNKERVVTPISWAIELQSKASQSSGGGDRYTARRHWYLLGNKGKDLQTTHLRFANTVHSLRVSKIHSVLGKLNFSSGTRKPTSITRHHLYMSSVMQEEHFVLFWKRKKITIISIRVALGHTFVHISIGYVSGPMRERFVECATTDLQISRCTHTHLCCMLYR